MEPLGAPAATTYNALAAHIPTSTLYAIDSSDSRTSPTTGELLRVLDDGSVENVILPGGDAVTIGSSSSAAAFGEGAREDQMFYVARSGSRLGCFDVVKLEDCGLEELKPQFEPIDMAWSGGYFWGLTGNGDRAALHRVSLDGSVTTEKIPALDESRVRSGSFGAAWTYGNGNLGFMSNGGGSVQLKITSTDPITAEIVGYSTGATSNQLDGAMIPPAPGDVALSVTSERVGQDDAHIVTATVRNVGATPVTGYQMQLRPDAADSRPVTAPKACTDTSGVYQCIGGALQPGAQRSLSFALDAPMDPEVVAAQWSANVDLNEVDTDPANNVAALSLNAPVVVDVATEVKARVADTNGDGMASPGETIEIYVVISNNSAETLTGVEVQLDTFLPQTHQVTGQIAPGARRTIRFDSHVPLSSPEGGKADEIILSTIHAVANGTPVSARGGELIVLGDNARPTIKRPENGADSSANAAAAADGGSAQAAAQGTASEAGAQAAGSGSAANGADAGPGASGLSATGAESRSPALAIAGLCLLLAFAVGGAGLRRSRRRLSE